jgi:hypothetical protein
MPKPYSTDLRERAVEAVEAILLPLPRVDRVNEVETLGRAWRNCLGAYGSAIDAGRCAVYLWEAEKPAVCLVGRHGRLGWFLDEVKGPQNIEIEAEQLQVIGAAFAGVGVPGSRVVCAIENIIFCRSFTPLLTEDD